jgi:general secretion pathway protein H
VSAPLLNRTGKIKTLGFTLIEVMLVLFIMGIAVSTVLMNVVGQNQGELLKKQVQRFEVVFNMASDFAILNQQQLGMYVDQEKNTYTYLILDQEEKWQTLDLDETFASFTVPEEFRFELQLNDLPWEIDGSLFDEVVFDKELSVSSDGVEIGPDDEEEKILPPPQVLILSSGDITPFSMTFIYEADFSDDEPVYFRINGEDSVPLKREGPLDTL